MLHSIVAHSANFYLAFCDGIFHCLPALKSCFLASVRTVQKEEIDIAKAARLYALLDALPGRLVIRVGRKLGREVYILTFELLGIRVATQELLNR